LHKSTIAKLCLFLIIFFLESTVLFAQNLADTNLLALKSNSAIEQADRQIEDIIDGYT